MPINERHPLSVSAFPGMDPGERDMLDTFVALQAMQKGGGRRETPQEKSKQPKSEGKLRSALSRLNPLRLFTEPARAIYEKYLWVPDGSDRDGTASENSQK